MNPLIATLPLLLGVDAGWQPLPEGGMEYIIQIDPASMQVLREGEALRSDVPPAIGTVRSWRVIFGDDPNLPKETPSDAAAENPADTAARNSGADDLVPRAEDAPPTLPADLLVPGAAGAASNPGQHLPEMGANGEPPADAARQQTTFRSPRESNGGNAQAADQPVRPNQPASLDGRDPSATDAGDERSSADEAGDSSEPDTDDPPGEKPGKPWWPLSMTVAALAASVTGNVYLFWILREAHRRYRKLAAMLGRRGSAG